MNIPIVNSHNSWSKLEEVWLGDVYPASWYDHLEAKVRDCFYELTEKTQEDLKIIEKKLQEFGVTVCRPVYDNIDDYLDHNGCLKKPEITPRDYYITIGNTLYAKPIWSKTSPWQQHIDRYHNKDIHSVKPILQNEHIHLTSASTVRAGKDLYFDLGPRDAVTKQELINSFNQDYLSLLDDYRINLLFNGGHIDGCFALLKPGLILASSYYSEYDKTFPNWTIINCTNPEFQKHQQYRTAPGNGKWWLPGVSDNKSFNEHIIEHAQDWVGDYTETYFEVNCLVVDEKNVLILGENEKIQKELETHGITAHSLPFRTRTFWDGGLHCLTLDIRRQSKIEDFFPGKEINCMYLDI